MCTLRTACIAVILGLAASLFAALPGYANSPDHGNTRVVIGASGDPFPFEPLKPVPGPTPSEEGQTVPGPQLPPSNIPHLPPSLSGLPKPDGRLLQPPPGLSTSTELGVGLNETGVTPDEAHEGGGYFECNQKWEWIASFPSGYVLGNCQNEAHLHRTEYDNNISGYNWDGGKIFGDYGGNCGWLHSDAYLETGSFTECDPPSTSSEDFIYHQGSTYWTWGETDGQLVKNTYNCKEYANYYPWYSGNVDTNYTGVTVPAGSERLLIRYLTLYESSDGTGYYIMARDSSIKSGEGNWVFIPASCIPKSA